MPLYLSRIATKAAPDATAAVSYARYITKLPPGVLPSLLDLLDVNEASKNASTVVFDDPTTGALAVDVMMVKEGLASSADLPTWNAGGGQFGVWAQGTTATTLTLARFSALATQIGGEPLPRLVEIYGALLPLVVNSTGVQQTESRLAVAVANTFAADVCAARVSRRRSSRTRNTTSRPSQAAYCLHKSYAAVPKQIDQHQADQARAAAETKAVLAKHAAAAGAAGGTAAEKAADQASLAQERRELRAASGANLKRCPRPGAGAGGGC